jgi:hypothetical protein
MMSRGFKPVGWVGGVAAAALGCYMLSLNVASERAELAKLERNIIMTKKAIRSLETELGTRGRLQQLESWNANILALSAPTSAQFLDTPMTLARFDQREQTLEERSAVQLASADTSGGAAPQPAERAPIRYAAAEKIQPQPAKKPSVQPKLASLDKKAAQDDAAPARKGPLIDDKLVSDIKDAAKAESGRSVAGQ